MGNAKKNQLPEHISFQEWCRSEGGLYSVAMLLGVTYRTVHSWYYVKGNPSIPTMQRLIKISEGRLSYESIIDSTQPLHKRGD